MDIFNTKFLGNPVYLWLAALGVVLLIFLIALILRNWLIRRVSTQNGTSRNVLQSFIVSAIVQTRAYFVLVVALYAGSLIVDLTAVLEDVLEMVIITVALIQFGFWITSLINFWINRRIREELERNNTNATTLSGLGMVARIILWSLIVLMILENVTGIEVNTLVASLGITGVAVALAVQNILSDLFASLSITLDRPFVIGDSINVGEFNGTVEHIGLKSTRVRSLSGEQLIFSNSDLLSSRVRNYKRMERRRVAFFLNLSYMTPPEKVEKVPKILSEIISRQPQVTFDRAHFKEFRDSSLNFEVVYYVENPDYLLYMDIQQAINLDILRRFSEEEVEFAYPAQIIYAGRVPSNESTGPDITIR